MIYKKKCNNCGKHIQVDIDPKDQKGRSWPVTCEHCGACNMVKL